MRLFFLDDAGNASIKSNERYFAFGGFSIDSSETGKLRDLQKAIWGLHPELGLPEDELKFSHVASMNKKSLEKNPFHRLGFPIELRRQIINHALKSLSELTSIQIIVSVVDKKYAFGADNKEHGLRQLLERIQLSSDDLNEDFLLICDEEQQHQVVLRSVLHEQKSLYLNFSNVLETLFFAPSVLSPGIQFADLITGSVTRMLNYNDQGYFHQILPHLRRSPWNPETWAGYGLAVFPKLAFNDLKIESMGLVPKT